tara:strand:+ start:110 stop:853 length:744 start_codon:yes stop_codon:yes gene_type:complete
MSSYKVYYINLDKSTRRREFMENQFKKLQIPITRISAVYGKELPMVFKKNAKKQQNFFIHNTKLNDGEIGITKTFFDLWKKISTQDEDFSIILEDDALLTNNFFEDLQSLLNLITPNDFIDIVGKKGFYQLEKNAYLTKFLTPGLTMHGQIIGKQAAKKLAQNLTHFYAPIDVLKQDIFRHKVNVYTTNKNYIIHNHKNLGGTTIHQKIPILNKILREILRPFRQLLTLVTHKIYRTIRNYLFYSSM